MQHITRIMAEPSLNWPMMVAALRAGHALPMAELGDQFLKRGDDTLLSRAAWIDGLGTGVKTVTVLPNNAAKGLPTVNGVMSFFDDVTGLPIATLDSDLVTRWKTAGDSVLGATLLAKPNPKILAILGAGAVAESLIEAYPALFPSIEHIHLWSRSHDKAQALAASVQTDCQVTAFERREDAVCDADIISTATMSHEPVLMGEWVKKGAHVDLIGAFKADMREADDALLRRGRLFVDSRQTTIEHIGELIIPLASGAITERDILGDYYELCSGAAGRLSADDITLLKNGGGAHLDLMCANAILCALKP